MTRWRCRVNPLGRQTVRRKRGGWRCDGGRRCKRGRSGNGGGGTIRGDGASAAIARERREHHEQAGGCGKNFFIKVHG